MRLLLKRIVLPAGAALAALAMSGGAPAAAGAATDVTGTARQWVNVRNAPNGGAPSVGSLSGGQQITIACQVTGSTVNGPGGSTNLWDKLADGRFVSHSYVTGLSANPYRCDALPVGVTARQWVNVRNAPNGSAASVGSLSAGQPVAVLCQVAGSTVNGPGGSTNLWDKLGEGRFVSHSYIAGLTTATACTESTPAPKAGLTAEQNAFLNLVSGPARQNFAASRVPASVTIAQAILESGWGRGDIPRTANNFFGAKCNGTAKGTIATGCRSFPTRECDATTCYATTAPFRVYASPLDSVRDHAAILGNKRYAAAYAYSADPNRFAAEIARAGYATDPNYPTLLTNLMVKFDLYRYDR